jgi:hypothetical protein
LSDAGIEEKYERYLPDSDHSTIMSFYAALTGRRNLQPGRKFFQNFAPQFPEKEVRNCLCSIR